MRAEKEKSNNTVKTGIPQAEHVSIVILINLNICVGRSSFSQLLGALNKYAVGFCGQ